MFSSLSRGAGDDTLPFSTPTIPTDTIPIIFSFIHFTHTEYMYLSLINKTCYSELQKQIYWERAFTNYLSNVPGDKNNLKEQYMSDILYIKAENRKEKETIKLLVLGRNNSGKELLTRHFIRGHHYVDEFEFDYENEYSRSLVVDDKQVHVRVTFQDYSSTDEEYQCMLDQYIRSNESFLVMYSIYDNISFEYAEKMVRKVERVKDYQYDSLEIPAILVAYDDPDVKLVMKDNMDVTTVQVEQLTKEWRIEHEKAKIGNGNDVTRIFEMAVRMVLENRNPKPKVIQPNKKCCLM